MTGLNGYAEDKSAEIHANVDKVMRRLWKEEFGENWKELTKDRTCSNCGWQDLNSRMFKCNCENPQNQSEIRCDNWKKW
jgi:hypothetical protein